LAGGYGVANGPDTIAVVERKTLENLVASLSDGTMAFQMQRLGEVARAAVVVEGRYSPLFKLEHVPAAFIADGLARLEVRYPEVPVVFADSRKFAEEWTYRFLAAAPSSVRKPDPEIVDQHEDPRAGELPPQPDVVQVSRGGA
jgi:hypothetical protein